MIKNTKKAFALILSAGLLMNVNMVTQASEDVSITLGKGENAVSFLPGTYDINMTLLHADKVEEHEESSSSGALVSESKLIIDENGNASVESEFIQTTVYGFAGAFTDFRIYQEHNYQSDSISVNPITTFSFKPSAFVSTTYTAVGEFSFDIPFSNQDGVFGEMDIATSLQAMVHDAYIYMDFSPYRADYSELNIWIELMKSYEPQVTKDSWNRVDTLLNSFSYSLRSEQQSIVEGYIDDLFDIYDTLEFRDSETKDAMITAKISANEASYIMTIPEVVALGELSQEEDVAVAYNVEIEIIAGNVVEDFVIEVSSDEFGDLASGSNTLRYKNTFEKQEYSTSESKEAYFIIEAANTVSAEGGDYVGDVEFRAQKISK